MAIIGSVCDGYADEKIALEVEVLNLLRDGYEWNERSRNGRSGSTPRLRLYVE